MMMISMIERTIKMSPRTKTTIVTLSNYSLIVS